MGLVLGVHQRWAVAETPNGAKAQIQLLKGISSYTLLLCPKDKELLASP